MVFVIVMKRWQRASIITISRIMYVYVCMDPVFTFIGALTSIFVVFVALLRSPMYPAPPAPVVTCMYDWARFWFRAFPVTAPLASVTAPIIMFPWAVKFAGLVYVPLIMICPPELSGYPWRKSLAYMSIVNCELV